MSIPERIWRIVRGRWLIADEHVPDTRAEAQAAQELNDSLQSPYSGSARPLPGREYRSAASPHRTAAIQNPKSTDPLAADLALLGAPPACSMETLDRIYAERLAEFRPDAFPPDSPQRAEATAHRAALAAAYERLRDAINTTETRFEKLEF